MVLRSHVPFAFVGETSWYSWALLKTENSLMLIRQLVMRLDA